MENEKIEYIYFSEQFNNKEIHKGDDNTNHIGVGRTNDIERRLKEHNTTSSKIDGIVIKFSYTIPYKWNDFEDFLSKDINYIEKKYHNTLLEIGFKCKKEIFYGKSLKDFGYVCKKGEELSIDLIKRLELYINKEILKKDKYYPKLLSARYYQYIVSKIITEYFDKNNVFLLSFDCGKGKTLGIGHTLNELYDTIKNMGHVCIISTKPSTLEQYDVMFNTSEFREKYAIVKLDEEVNTGDFNFEKLLEQSGNKPIIFIVSKQYLDGILGKKSQQQNINKKFNISFKNTMKNKISFVIFDEGHWGATGQINSKIHSPNIIDDNEIDDIDGDTYDEKEIQNLFNKDVKILYSSATPNKILYKYNNFGRKFQFYLNNSIEEAFLKMLNNLKDNPEIDIIQSGKEFFDLFTGCNENSILNEDYKEHREKVIFYTKEYIKNLNIDNLINDVQNKIVKTVFIGVDFNKDYKEILVQQLDINKYGFDIAKLYLCENDVRIYENVVEDLFVNIFNERIEKGENEYISDKNKCSLFEKMIFDYTLKGNRNLLNVKHTIMVKVYFGTNSKLNGNIEFIKKVLSKISYLKNNYEFLEIYTNFNGNLKQTCIDAYNKAKENDKNLIILYGASLNIGIDLPEINADIFIDLSNTSSMDVKKQCLGRIQRPGEDKKYCFYFDMNLCSAIAADYKYQEIIKKQSINEYLITNNIHMINLSKCEIDEIDNSKFDEINTLIENELNSGGTYTEDLCKVITNDAVYEDIYKNAIETNNISVKFRQNSELYGSSIKKTLKVSQPKQICEETKKEITEKLPIYLVLLEYIKIYELIHETDVYNIKDIVKIIINTEEYYQQFVFNMNKVIKELNIKIYNNDVDNIIEYIINSFDYNKLDNEKLYNRIISPINRKKFEL